MLQNEATQFHRERKANKAAPKKARLTAELLPELTVVAVVLLLLPDAVDVPEEEPEEEEPDAVLLELLDGWPVARVMPDVTLEVKPSERVTVLMVEAAAAAVLLTAWLVTAAEVATAEAL